MNHLNNAAPSHTLIEVFPSGFKPTHTEKETPQPEAIPSPMVLIRGLPLTTETGMAVVTAVVESLMESGNLDPAALMAAMGS